MKKYIVFNVPAYGHINPTLAVVKELVNRGNDVIYYAFDEFKDKIESTGAKYRSYHMDISLIDLHQSGNFLELMKILLKVTSDELPALLSEVKEEKPDCLIHDSLCLWGKLIGKRLCVPTVSSITTFVVNKEILQSSNGQIPFYRRLIMLIKTKSILRRIQKVIGQKAGLEEMLDLLMNTEKLNIVYTSRMLQPQGNSFHDEYQFVGASISERKGEMNELEKFLEGKPLIYISLGTIMNQNFEFYHHCFEAFRDMNVTVVLSIGRNTDITQLGDIPSNFIVKNFVPQLDVLAVSDLFVTHGGMNSVHEGLYYKVPLIVVPQHKEQQMVAERVTQYGAGIYLEKIDSVTIMNAAKTVLANADYKKRAIELSESLIIAGGYKKAADTIESYCES